ncbi:nucleoside triphosphate pyrophosphohydrolase [Lentzea sp. HUAS12]|uniref:nucleoside triphosphate pyrophosphohydrolase n=1 Tax=Lentzea sp. HUAS12 TaxID=2951806 RepID=UPI00209FDDB5|nr:nucleoside triphosphate pyrophosphohydrolase [Lentzea sp. HUAS12]USX56214.1 nucleoside triphosphate pyrophosphohydrolase [Lentzea sp. HUAS12]
MRVEHNKLVRDLIPQIIEAEGRHPTTRILDEGPYRDALRAKLVEEAIEARDAPRDRLPTELADIVEVISALLHTVELSWDDLFALADHKRGQRGGFVDRILLENVQERDDSASNRSR